MKAVYLYNGDPQVNLMESSTDIRYGERQMIYKCSSYYRYFHKANILF